MHMFSNSPSFWRDRFQASAMHFSLSLGIALLSALLVFGIWYPTLYREVSGGRELFFLVVTVDVILGPLVTFAIFNRVKPWSVLRRDLAVIGFIQFAALGYGLWVVCMARPVHIVFESDRFSVVHAIDVPPQFLAKAVPELNTLPLTGPTLIALRPFKDSNEKFDATVMALQGVPLASRADLWQTYDKAIPDILKAAKPASALKSRFSDRAAEIDHVLASVGRTADNVVCLPLVGRKSFWTAFLDPVTAQIVATMPLDSF